MFVLLMATGVDVAFAFLDSLNGANVTQRLERYKNLINAEIRWNERRQAIGRELQNARLLQLYDVIGFENFGITRDQVTHQTIVDVLDLALATAAVER